jgi:hypothetical protein
VGAGQIHPTFEHIKKILISLCLKTEKGVCSVCRMINWLRKFVQNAARLLKPIIDLTAKNKSEVVKWGS